MRIPQLIVQSLVASNSLSTITLLSIVASVLTISSGIIKHLIFFLIAKYQGKSVGGYQKQGNEGEDEEKDNGEWGLTTAYSTMDASGDDHGSKGDTDVRKALQSHAVQKWTTREVVAWLEEQNLGSAAIFAEKHK